MKVIWTIDATEGQTPAEAAEEAFFAMQRRGTTAVCFTVCDAHGQETFVDLERHWASASAKQRMLSRANRQETQYYLAVATQPERPAIQTSGPLRTLEAFQARYEQLRKELPSDARFFRVAINPFAVVVHGFAVREARS